MELREEPPLPPEFPRRPGPPSHDGQVQEQILENQNLNDQQHETFEGELVGVQHLLDMLSGRAAGVRFPPRSSTSNIMQLV